jgi:CDP-glucose 4,6-dehydratase
MNIFNNTYNGKKVLVTGNTGFKGSWLSIWLKSLGAKVYGLSNGIPTNPSNYIVSDVESIIDMYYADIIDYSEVLKVIKTTKPDFIFHLAAQPLVIESYNDPKTTMNVNILGTVNILEALRQTDIKCTCILITSDKCYDNVEWIWGYKETDILGGKDPYSASKGAAELMIKSYSESYFKNPKSNVKVSSARAGNVIGGGDWAKYRIIPDAVQAWSTNKELILRSPNATRPWQHVLEPLSGYLRLGELLYSNKDLCGESFNFGPKPETNFSVEHLMIEMSKYWSEVKWKVEVLDNNVKEAGLLKLNCDKALHSLDWVPNLNFNDTVTLVANWYKTYFNNPKSNMKEFTLEQIKFYEKVAYNQNLSWIK